MFRKKAVRKAYDKENQKPVIKCGICTGEQVAGFQDIHTGKIEEIMFIQGEKDLKTFMDLYGITDSSMIKKVY